MVPELHGLTRESLETWMDELIRIDQDTIGEIWQESHFRADLPGKWDYSAIVVSHGRPTAFAIVSRKTDSLHVHRIAVERESRRLGLGPLLLSHVASRAEAGGVPRVTLRVAAANEAAVRFYDRLGFQRKRLESGLFDLSIPAGVLNRACVVHAR